MRVQQAFEVGIEGLVALKSPDLYLWLVKIYYGLLFRNLTLALDLRDADAGPIVTPEDLSRFRFLHLMLQGIRGFSVEILNGGLPASCVIMKTQTSTLGHPSLNWDYFDVPHAPFLAVRVGPVAIFSGMADFGAFLHFAKDTWHVDIARDLDLHPAQFQEFAALSAAIAMWVSNRSEFEVVVDGSNLTVVIDVATATTEISPFMNTPEFMRLWAAVFNLQGGANPVVDVMPTVFLDLDQKPRHISMEADIAEGRILHASAARRLRSSGGV
jgi:hypothetical protein